MKHTPGPWKAHYHESGNEVQRGLAGYSIQADEGIAYSISRKANAHLIAAAPELLSVARTAVNALERRGLSFEYYAMALKQAIAKATGEGE